MPAFGFRNVGPAFEQVGGQASRDVRRLRIPVIRAGGRELEGSRVATDQDGDRILKFSVAPTERGGIRLCGREFGVRAGDGCLQLLVRTQRLRLEFIEVGIVKHLPPTALGDVVEWLAFLPRAKLAGLVLLRCPVPAPVRPTGGSGAGLEELGASGSAGWGAKLGSEEAPRSARRVKG